MFCVHLHQPRRRPEKGGRLHSQQFPSPSYDCTKPVDYSNTCFKRPSRFVYPFPKQESLFNDHFTLVSWSKVKIIIFSAIKRNGATGERKKACIWKPNWTTRGSSAVLLLALRSSQQLNALSFCARPDGYRKIGSPR